MKTVVTTAEHKTFKPAVSSHGAGNARIFFLGGFPSSDDLVSGSALSGYQEKSLDIFLRAEKASISQAYRALFVKEKLEYGGLNPKKLFLALSKVDLKSYTDMLFTEIKEVNPNVIVPLDDLALSAVFTHINDIKKQRGRAYYVDMYRGSVLPLRGDFQSNLPALVRVIPTLGPKIINQNWAARAYVRIDFKRIVENSLSRAPIKKYGLLWIARNATELYRYFERGLAKNDGYVSLDIETYGGFMTCISFCFDSFEAVSVPLSPYFYKEIGLSELAMIWRLVAQLLAHPIAKCNQNIKFDWTILERHGFFVNNVVHDTMLKAGLLYPQLPKALDFLTSIYTPLAYYKDEGREYDPRSDSRDQLLIYNAQDSLAAQIVNKKQEEELKENGQHELYHKEVAPLILIYKDIDEARILVDSEQRLRLLDSYTTKLNSNLEILRSLINNPVYNPASPKQAGKLIYEELKYPKRQKTNENGIKSWKTDKETLDDLLINHPEDNTMGKVGYMIVSRQIVCRKLAKVLEYINTPLHPDNSLGGSSNLAGTTTGRSSFSKTIDEILCSQEEIDAGSERKKRLGRSLQTITKHGFNIDEEVFDDFEDSKIANDLRSMFIPPHGWVFIEGDGSQAEARVVAVLAEDWELLASFDTKPKIHAKTAALIFNIDVNLITKDSPSVPRIGIAYYDMGKRIRHAGNLRLEAFRLSQMTHIAKSECARMLSVFHSNNPKIQGTFHKEIDEVLQRTRILETPYGRKCQYFDRFTSHLFKEATAQIPQGTVSDLTKFTMPRIKDKLKGYGVLYRFLTEQHDGILSVVRDFYWKDYAEEFKRQYERTIDFRRGSLKRDFDLTIPCELSKSEENWQNLEEFKL
jgi:DNA polymerase I-like protein with 3'-5' exonuclease and polymerase domains/uracil-DNA glycosylase